LQLWSGGKDPDRYTSPLSFDMKRDLSPLIPL
jgi:hypothetical protein